jgi:anti-sigma factor RsiW
MNNCADRDIQDLLPDMLHRMLAADDLERVEHHLAACESCREELAVLRVVKGAAVFAPAIDVGQIVRQIPPYQRITPVVEVPARNRVTKWLVAAAAAVLVIGGGSVLVGRQPNAVQSVATDNRSIAPLPRTGAVAAPAPVETEVRAAAVSQTHTYALASDVASLSDGDLVQLMNDMDNFDALPVSEPEPVIAVDSGDSL